MRHAIACFRAGVAGQPLPAKADRSNGKVVAICSAVGGVVSIGTFGLGMLIGRRTGGGPEPKE